MHKSFILGAIIASSGLTAAQSCQSSPVECNADNCRPCFCLGPDNVLVNAPTGPRTCDGDVAITVAGLYWRANQDGMEYAVENAVDALSSLSNSNNLIQAEYKTPKASWEGGLRGAFTYVSSCDGWDIGLTWTYFDGGGSSQDQVYFSRTDDAQEGLILLPLFSAFHGLQESLAFGITTASEIRTDWDADFNIADLELGRSYWVSKYLSMRPFLALRYARIYQTYELVYSGGSWSVPNQTPLNDEVHIGNFYKGMGPRAGFDMNWNFGCGWSLYSELAASILYGRFYIEQDEAVRQAVSPFSKGKVLDTEYRFHASRSILDLALGLQYATLVCDCKYGITVQLGWEQHLFFHQNQMWRVNRIGRGADVAPFRSNTGENDFSQTRGTLSTHGWTLTFKFDF